MNERWLALHDVDRVQEYVFGAPRLREIRGASALIDEVNEGRTVRLITAHEGCAIYAGGGGAAAHFPNRESAEAWVQEVRAAYREETVAATSTGSVAPEPFDPQSGAGFPEALAEAHRRLRYNKAAGEERTQLPTAPFLARCCRCGVFPASSACEDPDQPGESLLICSACLIRRTQRRAGVQAELHQHVEGRLGQELRRARDLNEVADEDDYLGVLYLDGNRMGERLRQVRTPECLGDFSDAVRKGVRDALFDTVDAAIRIPEAQTHLPLEVPLLGGDDLVIFLPAGSAFPFALELVRRIPESVARALSANSRSELQASAEISVCAGIIVAKAHTPIAGLVRLAQGLCKSAKRRYQQERKREATFETGCLDFQVVTAANWDAPEVIRERYQWDENHRLTARPYTLPEFEAFLAAADRVAASALPRGKLLALYRSFWEGPQQARLQYHALLMRSRKAQRDALWGSEDGLRVGVDAPWKAAPGGGTRSFVTPYPDLVEALRFIRPAGAEEVSEGEGDGGMTELDLSYRLTAETALHVGTGLGFARMVDDLVVRAKPARGGSPLPNVPGSTLKGRVRREAERIARSVGIRVHAQGPGERSCKADPCVACRLFGSTYREGTLIFSDACLGEEIAGAAEPGGGRRDPFLLGTVRAGNKLERATRCVEPQLLFTRENAAEGLVYEGRIFGGVACRPGDGEGLPVEIWLLLAALRLLDKVGGSRSRGLGRCSVALRTLTVDGAEIAGTLEELLCGADARAFDDCVLRVAGYAEANRSE